MKSKFKLILSKERNIIMLMLLSILLSILITDLASAVIEDFGSAKQNECISLVQQNEGVVFETIASVQLPNKQFVILNTNMTSQGSGFYNYSFCNTSQTGKYFVNGFDTDESWTYYFLITPNGENPSVSNAIFYIGLLALMGVFLLLVMWAYMQDQSQLARLWWFAFMWIPIISILFVGWNMARDFLSSQGMIEDTLYFGWIVPLILYPFLLLGLALYTFYWIYQNKEVQKLLNRGFSVDEAQRKVYGGRGR